MSNQIESRSDSRLRSERTRRLRLAWTAERPLCNPEVLSSSAAGPRSEVRDLFFSIFVSNPARVGYSLAG